MQWGNQYVLVCIHCPECVNTAKVFYMTDGERPEWRNSGGTLSCSPSAQRHCGTLNHFCFMLLEQRVCRPFPGSSSAPSISKDHLQPLWMGSKVLQHHIRAQTAAFRIPLSPGAVGDWGGSSLVLSYQSTAEENPITGMDIIISLIPVSEVKTGSTGQQIQTMVPFSNNTDEGMTGTDE